MLPDDLRSPASKSPITYSKVLVVEGGDAFQFFKAMLRHLNLLTEVEIRNFGEISNLTLYLKALKQTSGFERVTSLGIVRDAEANATSAFQSICRSLRQAGLAVPKQLQLTAQGVPKTSVFVLPDCRSQGMLDALCLQSVSNDPSILCVDQYFQCLQGQGLSPPGNIAKARLHAFLASRTKPDLLLGQAAHAGYFPWNSPAFDLLKQFLRNL